MGKDFSMFLMVALYFSEFLRHMVILFGSIAQMYVDHVIKKYKDPVIAFDSYSELPAIKDVTHLRRTKGIVSPNINFTPTMPFKTKKELFMSNSFNKQVFINMT